ncbi:MAG TPA: hypothetical protein VFA38_04975, partial [Nitrospirales bacterium]|nr:hypothetical protein [Nitrospirales bacterium]
MTTEELEQLLAEQPVARLHRLARGRVNRHFRLGKRRLIEALLRHSATNLAGLESDLKILIEEGARREKPAGPKPTSPVRPAAHAPMEPESQEAPVELGA